MLTFFDKIAYRVFLISKIIHRNIFGKGNYVDDAKIQTLFIMSLSQGSYVFFIMLDFFLAKYLEIRIPKYISLSGFIIFCLYNYLRYYKSNLLEEMEEKKSFFFKNRLITYIIVILYFVVGIFLFFITGDIVREILINK